ncbi:hypothetical protein PPL_12222 [Heterostelium album PN500]|uniref:tRNA(Ile)-lysidine/2-thiocytidine synthase N-terminal domain-containing protein n=1 Tax=Heterostelium pallidum (strain ATCC 26659 / Pp 5 / PN500) TaxID=670386 RepID=D3BM14_HETP5|nr:hypothetical protein PPL_12222 [Heterostelium album PN500]EFA77615.1 hypothetical protein PPL_12222 [Heterostelium album PN500]|eukprot:XP_020429743.1 hypothetical protein PPL_12222 [Heterostelium album PN500]
MIKSIQFKSNRFISSSTSTYFRGLKDSSYNYSNINNNNNVFSFNNDKYISNTRSYSQVNNNSNNSSNNIDNNTNILYNELVENNINKNVINIDDDITIDSDNNLKDRIIQMNNQDLIEYTKRRSLKTLTDKEKEILLYKFVKNMNDLNIDLQKNKFIIAAVSGGADSICNLSYLMNYCYFYRNDVVYSMALCFLLKGWCNRHGISLVAVTIDHGLVPPSEDIVAIAENIRKIDADIQHIVVKIDWFGSGVEGLAGMQPTLPLANASIYRPLLNIGKDELFGLCNAYNLRYTHDQANNLTTFERNRIRLALSKLLCSSSGNSGQQHDHSNNNSSNNSSPSIVQLKDFNNVLSIFREFRYSIEEQVMASVRELYNSSFSLELPMFRVDVDRIKKLSAPIGCRLLYQLSMIINGDYEKFRHQDYASLYRSVVSGQTRTLNQIIFYTQQNHIYIHPESHSSAKQAKRIVIEQQRHLRDGQPIQFGHHSLKFSKLSIVTKSINFRKSTLDNNIIDNNNNSNSNSSNSISNNNTKKDYNKYNNNNDDDNNNNNSKTITQKIQSLRLHSIRYYNPKKDERFIGNDIKALKIPTLARTLIPVVVNEHDEVLCIPHLSIWRAPRQYNVSISIKDFDINYKSDSLL